MSSSIEYRISSRKIMGNKVNWTMHVNRYPTIEEITEMVEQVYPSQGYGQSKVSKPLPDGNDWVVYVESYRSSD